MRVVFWMILFLLLLLQGYWAGVIAVITWFSYWYPAGWLLVMAVLVDGYLGAFESVPVLSLSMGAFVLFVEALKMYLLGAKSAHE